MIILINGHWVGDLLFDIALFSYNHISSSLSFDIGMVGNIKFVYAIYGITLFLLFYIGKDR